MYGKIVIRCELKVLTGMHIGASGTFSAIGAVDSPVVRDPMTQKPILPGSSLKGKLRTLLARSLCRNINQMPDFDKDDGVILRLFGSAEPVRLCRACPALPAAIFGQLHHQCRPVQGNRPDRGQNGKCHSARHLCCQPAAD